MLPEEDREMVLQEHLAELRTRLTRILIAFLIGIAIIFPFSNRLIRVFWNHIFNKELKIIVYSPLEWIIVQLVFSFVLALLVLYPYVVYELYKFARPGLYKREKRFIKMFVPFSYALFLLGVGFAYFIIIPKLYSLATVEYFGAQPYLSIKKTLYNALKIFVAFGLVFQIPALITIAVKLELLNSKWLKEKRLLIYLAVLILATNITLDITGLSQLIILALVVIMYELGIILARMMEKH